jgi:hypothetical protein
MKAIYITFTVLILSCSKNDTNISKVGELELEEISGIELAAGSGLIWSLEDSGNKNKIYGLDAAGKISNTITIADVDNNDWEDITSDTAGNLYIGDFGNNDNDRKDLAIYKIDKNALTGTQTNTIAKTSFNYPEQKEFPPKKSQRIFDVEAFFEHNGNFYLFTKNRSSRFDGSLNVYKVPNKPGNFPAKMIGSLNTCSTYKKCAVTAADISPDGKTVVLLTGDKVFRVTGFTDDDYSNANVEMIELGHFSQKEGVCFKDGNTLLITDEKDKKEGGYLYEFKLPALKGKP